MLRRLASAVLVSSFVLAFTATAPALAAPWWHINAETVPTNFSPGGTGQVMLVLSNLGDTPINGGEEPVVITDELPSGLVATGITGPTKNGTQVECVPATLSCRFAGTLNPYEQISIAIAVKVEEPKGSVLSLGDKASVEGGGGARVSRTLELPRQRPTGRLRRSRL